ncbi:MAG: histidine kinase dimerization/phospho-acceptor domain-containing protein [Myxococcales bacterium]|jgi:signal transduction histidine kinase
MPRQQAGPGSIAVLDSSGRLVAMSRELKNRLGPAGEASLCRALTEALARALESGAGDAPCVSAVLEVEGRSLEVLAERAEEHLLARVRSGEADERLETFARLAEGMAHDARNPLNALAIHLGLLSERLRRADPALAAKAARHLDAMREQVGRIESVLRRFMQFASPPEQAPLAIDLGELVSRAVSAFGHEAKRKGVVLAADVVGVEVEGDATQLGEAVLHLVKGGIDEGAGGGRLRVSVARSGSEAVLELAHDAPGSGPSCPVEAERAGRAERLLSLAEQIVELHRGNLKTRKEGRRRRVEVRLPLAGSADR